MYGQKLEISFSDARQKYLLSLLVTVEFGVTTRGWPLDICMQVGKAEKKLLTQISQFHWASSNVERISMWREKSQQKYIASSCGKFYAHGELRQK